MKNVPNLLQDEKEGKMRARNYFILLCVVQLCLTFTYGLSVTVAQTSENTAIEAPSEVKRPPVPELQDIVPRAANLGKRLEKLNRQLANLQTTDQVEEDLAPIVASLVVLTERLEQLKSAPDMDIGQLRRLKTDVELEANQIERIISQVTGGIGVIEDAIDEWRLEQQKWSHWRDALSEDKLYVYVEPTFVSVNKIFGEAQRTIDKHLKPILAIQQKTWQSQNRILDLKQRADSMIVAMRGEALGIATPILFSKHFLAQFNQDLFGAFLKGVQAIKPPRSQFIVQKGWLLLLLIVAVVSLAVVFDRRPDLLKRSDRLKWFANRPVATGCFVGIAIFIDLFESTILLRLILMFVLILSMGRLLSGMVQEKWLKQSIFRVLAIRLVVEIFNVINLPAPLLRVFVVAVTLTGLTFLGRHLRLSRGKNSKLLTLLLWLLMAVLAFVFGSEALGFNRLAEYLFFSILDTMLEFALAWMLVRFLQGIIEVLVRGRHLQKFALIRNNAKEIIAKTDMICAIVIGLWLVLSTLRTWKVYADIATPLADILAFGVTIGKQYFSIGLVLAAGAVLYGAFLLSWSLQSLMLDGVILSRKMQQGVRISMARLMHYAIVLVGFLLTLSVLGVDFTNLAIIGGALGVGIGFGMQTIVNNFVCGLIMLFERPVKVGDSVEFGSQMGRVKQVGLRATVVATYDNAEIVVPNADLITSQVTNWTLAERRRRLKLPVGVAYGADVALVIQTLMECAEDNVLVLSNPKPAVIFFGFGDSSLDFELRVWIADFDSRRLVQSEINQDIDQRFRELGIEIPFPQRDLHLRSVDATVSGLSVAKDSE